MEEVLTLQIRQVVIFICMQYLVIDLEISVFDRHLVD